jgi:hypothetical protein
LIILTTQIAKEPEDAGQLIVVIFPSSAVWYLIIPLFTDIKEECENWTVVVPKKNQIHL